MKTHKSSLWWRIVRMTAIFPLVFFSFAALISSKPDNKNHMQWSNELKGWWYNKNQTDYKVGTDDQIFITGKKSAFIESIAEKPANFLAIAQMNNVKNYRGKRIKMTGYLKAQGDKDTCALWIRVDNYAAGRTGDIDNMLDRPVTGTRDWTKCELVFDVPDAECYFNFGFLLSGAGKCWCDDISFEIVDPAVAKTVKNINEVFPKEMVKKYYEQYPDGLPEKLPENLNFED
jgi:hypothetical protein